MTYGLVLGAGGATAWVWHVGVLRVLHDDLGMNPAEAGVVVGTSAGASVAASVRAGLGTPEIFQAVTRPPSPEQRTRMVAELKAARKTLLPLSPGMLRHALPNGKGSMYALAGLLPPGWFPTGFLAAFPGVDRLERWPDGLWIPSVRATDGDVVVFGRDRLDVPIDVAVQASSAVPGMFRPTMVDGTAFVDGGVASSTHADLLLRAGLDLVIVSAPMVRPGRRLLARHARRMLATEVDTLRSAGIEVIVVQGSATTAEVTRGFPRRNPAAAQAIADHAAEATRLALDAAPNLV
jgi:NTE family protein